MIWKVIGVAAVPTAHGAPGQADVGAADHAVGIEKLADAQAVAFRAGAVGIVEAEHARFEFLQAVITIGAGVTGAEQFVIQSTVLHPWATHGNAVGQYDGGFERFGQALLQVCRVP